MALITCKENLFALGQTYRGPMAVVEFTFQMVIPGGCDAVALATQTGMFATDVLQIVKDNYLGYRIDKEVVSGAPDRYRVVVFVAGETTPAEGTIQLDQIERPEALIVASSLVAVILAIAFIAIIIAPIGYKLWNGTFGGDLGAGTGNFFKNLFGENWLLVVGGAGLIVAALVLSPSRGSPVVVVGGGTRKRSR